MADEALIHALRLGNLRHGHGHGLGLALQQLLVPIKGFLQRFLQSRDRFRAHGWGRAVRYNEPRLYTAPGSSRRVAALLFVSVERQSSDTQIG